MNYFRIHIVFFLLLCADVAFSQVVNLKGRWKFHIGDDPSYSSSRLDDSAWEDIWVPAAWEDEGFNGYDGFAWYRIKFDGRKLDKDAVYYVNLGFIDDADEAYLNERIIGFSGHIPPKFKTAYNNERKYVLPSQVINFEGMNTLAVRVFDGVHRGGIVDGPVGIYNMEDNARLLIDLQGIWSFATSKKGERVTDDQAWEKIMVPSAWEFQGMKYDGFAWYRRTFNLPANFTKQPLVLLLGKIDDFDRVYLNGKYIGSTNDHRPFGQSHSYEENRVYEIPIELLKYNGSNTIEILVEDTGNIGGIYEGIVGITTRSNYEKFFND